MIYLANDDLSRFLFYHRAYHEYKLTHALHNKTGKALNSQNLKP